MTMHSFRVNSIHPQSFIPIGLLVSEILGNTPKMNAILLDRIQNEPFSENRSFSKCTISEMVHFEMDPKVKNQPLPFSLHAL